MKRAVARLIVAVTLFGVLGGPGCSAQNLRPDEAGHLSEKQKSYLHLEYDHDSDFLAIEAVNVGVEELAAALEEEAGVPVKIAPDARGYLTTELVKGDIVSPRGSAGRVGAGRGYRGRR